MADSRQNGRFEAPARALPYTYDGDIDLADTLGLECIFIGAVEPHGVAYLVSNQFYLVSVLVDSEYFGTTHRQRNSQFFSETPQSYHREPLHNINS